MKFLAVICRCRDEFFIQEFCDYYLKQGVDDVYIIDDDSEDKTIYNFLDSPRYVNVNLIKTTRQYHDATTSNNPLNTNDETNKLYGSIRHDYEWMIYVDVDEFITTKRNFAMTIREQLQNINTQHPHVHWILSPWVLMSGLHNIENPKSILSSILYRHDQNIKHLYPVKKFKCTYNRIYCKSIFKPQYFEYIKDHGPPPGDEIKYNGIDLQPNRISGYCIKKLRNHGIETGVFLCYHYRYISLQHARSKLNTNGWYINDGYTLEDLQATYPEIYDDTFLRK